MDIDSFSPGGGRLLKENGDIFNIADGLAKLTANANEPFTESQVMPKTFANTQVWFGIKNDGDTQDITFTINSETYIVKAGEFWSGYLKPFTQVTVSNPGSNKYRAWGRC